MKDIDMKDFDATKAAERADKHMSGIRRIIDGIRDNVDLNCEEVCCLDEVNIRFLELHKVMCMFEEKMNAFYTYIQLSK